MGRTILTDRSLPSDHQARLHGSRLLSRSRWEGSWSSVELDEKGDLISGEVEKSADAKAWVEKEAEIFGLAKSGLTASLLLVIIIGF